MTLYYRVKDPKTGQFRMIEQDIKSPDPVPLVMPSSATGTQAGMKRYICTACTPPKPFGSAGVASVHFGRVHKELVQDKDSWRKYVKQFGDIDGLERTDAAR